MSTSGLMKYASALVALAICSACGAPAVTPSNVALTGRYITAAHPNLEPSKSKTFEYVMSGYNDVAIFDWPKSDKQIGSFASPGGQACTNVLYGNGKKFFWIVASANQIVEYKVLKTPVRTLKVSAGQPSGCAMNAAGDLAVGIFDSGDIVIFKHARGKGVVITTAMSSYFFLGYDNEGNLFLDGFGGKGEFALVELPAGSKKLQTITPSNTVEFPGSVQWDGKYLTILDQEANAIYRYTVSGTRAKLEGTVSLSGASDCAQTWIGAGVVFCADAGNEEAEIFKYPAGGSPIATLEGTFEEQLGIVSVDK